jgi:hypothetical protein
MIMQRLLLIIPIDSITKFMYYVTIASFYVGVVITIYVIKYQKPVFVCVKISKNKHCPILAAQILTTRF